MQTVGKLLSYSRKTNLHIYVQIYHIINTYKYVYHIHVQDTV